MRYKHGFTVQLTIINREHGREGENCRVIGQTWAPAGFFAGVGNEWGDGIPQRVPGAEPRWGLGAKHPEADDVFSK